MQLTLQLFAPLQKQMDSQIRFFFRFLSFWNKKAIVKWQLFWTAIRESSNKRARDLYRRFKSKVSLIDVPFKRFTRKTQVK